MQRQTNVSYYLKWICIVGLIFSWYILLVLLNPKLIGVLDSLFLRAPCCEEKRSSEILTFPNYLLWKLATIIYDNLGGHNELKSNFLDRDSCCKVCRQYQTLRCHFRFNELNLRSLQWHQLNLKNAALHSTGTCDFEVLTEKFNYFFPSYLFLDKEQTDVLESSFIDIKSIYRRFIRTPPPAVEVKDLSIDMRSLFRPVIDINATGIVINVVTEKDAIRINSSIGVPLTTVRIGDWLLHEIFDLIPPPPKEEGLYPRVGTINLTDVRIISTTIEDKNSTINEIIIPDEFFYPLYHITHRAGSTDQKFIGHVLKKSFIMVLRKHAINKEDFISKSMEAFLANLEKSTELVHEATDFVHDKFSEWTGAIDRNGTLRQFIAKVEKNWYNTMKEKDIYLSKFYQEATLFWEGVDENIYRVRQNVLDTLEKMEQELNIITTSGKEVIPHMTKEVKDNWRTMKRDWIEAMKEKNAYLNKLSQEKDNYLTKLSQDAVLFWEGVDENISRAGQQMVDTLEKVDEEWDLISKNGKEVFPKISKEVKNTWDVIKQSFHETGLDLNIRARKVEEELKGVIDEVAKDAQENMKKMHDNFNNFFDGLRGFKNADKDEF